MRLASIGDLNAPPEEVAACIAMAKKLSAMYDDFLLLEQHDVVGQPDNRPPGIHASELYPCLRKPVYSVMGTEKRKLIPKFWLQRFKVGHALHSVVQNDFHRMAKRSQRELAMRLAEKHAEELNCVVEFQDEVPVSPAHQALAAHYQMYSSADGVFTFINKDTGDVVLRVGLEIKTESPAEYEKLKEPKAEHLRQAHLYMAALDLPLMWFFYMNKGNQNNTNSETPYLVVWQPKLWAELEDRIKTIHDFAARGELPARTETVMCEFCPWNYTCDPPNVLAKAQQGRSPTRRETVRGPGG